MLRRFVVGMCAVAAMATGFVVPAAAETITYLLPAPLSLPAFGPFVVAKQRGYFKAVGLEVEFQVAKGGVDDSNGPGDGHPKTEIGIKTLTLAPA